MYVLLVDVLAGVFADAPLVLFFADDDADDIDSFAGRPRRFVGECMTTSSDDGFGGEGRTGVAEAPTSVSTMIGFDTSGVGRSTIVGLRSGVAEGVFAGIVFDGNPPAGVASLAVGSRRRFLCGTCHWFSRRPAMADWDDDGFTVTDGGPGEGPRSRYFLAE